jgi:hypothetical protein
MNCDQVFNALTRGPFPTGNDALDERVERHLGHCGSCRRLAAALQPAVELFEEAVAPEESCRLPAYWGDVFSRDDGRPATRTKTPKRRRRMTGVRAEGTQDFWKWEHAWRVAAALLLGMALGGVMRAMLAEDDRAGMMAAHDRYRSRSTTHHDRMARLWALDNLQMTAACGPLSFLPAAGVIPIDDGPAISAPPADAVPHAARIATDGTDDSSRSLWSAFAEQNCCTECHHAGAPVGISEPARFRVASSCALCHDSSDETAMFAQPLGGE